MFVLDLLGTIALRGGGARPVPPAAQQKRPLGLLAILGLGGRRGLSRDRIETYLWPESSKAHARHALDQLVYAIRQALGSDAVLSTGRELRLNPDVVRADVREFEEAIRAGQWAAAVSHYKGPLLDGFSVADSRELESWIDTHRARLLQEYQTAVERLANLSAEAGDHAHAVSWWRRLANSDPLSAGLTKKLMLALAAAGDRAGAVQHARQYQDLVRHELEMEPDSGIAALASTFSHPGATETLGTAVPRKSPAAPSPPAPTPQPLRMKRSRMVAALSCSAVTGLLIGATPAENRAAANAAHRGSRIALPAARAAYRSGLDAWSDGSKPGLDSAVTYFRRATELDHEYAEAYAGLANAYVMLGYFGYRPSDAMFPNAKRAALRSIQLDSTLASALPALAYELTWERDFAGADSAFRKAIVLDPTYGSAQAMARDPTYATAHQWYAILLSILGQEPDGVVASRRAVNQDPFSLSVPVIELPFTKWFTTYPALAGVTSYGPGTMAGEVLSRIDDGTTTHLIARYEVTDPGGTHSFKAVIQGKANNKTGKYDLNGIVTWGWMTGAHVHVIFQRITPCEFGTLNRCFQGTIQIERR